MLSKLVCSTTMETSPHDPVSIHFFKRLGIMFKSAWDRPPLSFIEQVLEFAPAKPSNKILLSIKCSVDGRRRTGEVRLEVVSCTSLLSQTADNGKPHHGT